MWRDCWIYSKLRRFASESNIILGSASCGTFCDAVEGGVCHDDAPLASSFTPFPSEWSHSQKSLSCSLPVTHKSARGQSHVQLATASESSQHTHKSPALKHQTGILFNFTFLKIIFLLRCYFTFLPLSALTCISCDWTQTFFRYHWYSDGLGGAWSPDFVQSPLAFTFHLCPTHCYFTFQPPDACVRLTCRHLEHRTGLHVKWCFWRFAEHCLRNKNY